MMNSNRNVSVSESNAEITAVPEKVMLSLISVRAKQALRDHEKEEDSAMRMHGQRQS